MGPRSVNNFVSDSMVTSLANRPIVHRLFAAGNDTLTETSDVSSRIGEGDTVIVAPVARERSACVTQSVSLHLFCPRNNDVSCSFIGGIFDHMSKQIESRELDPCHNE